MVRCPAFLALVASLALGASPQPEDLETIIAQEEVSCAAEGSVEACGVHLRQLRTRQAVRLETSSPSAAGTADAAGELAAGSSGSLASGHCTASDAKRMLSL